MTEEEMLNHLDAIQHRIADGWRLKEDLDWLTETVYYLLEKTND